MGFKLSSHQQQSAQMQQNLLQNNIQFFWFVYLPGNQISAVSLNIIIRIRSVNLILFSSF